MKTTVRRVALGLSTLAIATVLSGASFAAGLGGNYGKGAGTLNVTMSDPLEPLNRVVHAVNEVVDLGILTPVDILYRAVVPSEGRKAVHNVLDNAKAPVRLVNNLLQGDLKSAQATAERFVINTTVGVAGVMDIADTSFGIAEPEKQDLGLTMGKYGVPAGPYLELPLLGPSNARDALGMVVDNFAFDPLNIWARNTDRDGFLMGRAIATGIDTKDQMRGVQEGLRRDSGDYYEALRSAYTQRRYSLVNGGATMVQGNDIP